MKKLLRYLSPFAPDQSGACGVLYELGGLIVIADAGGCAGNICGFDEPRWFTKKSAVFSAGLRDMDAIMGRDDRLIAKLKTAHDQLGGAFSAIVGTPVPAVIATDMKALKRMGENSLGIPCITISCDGTAYYDEGEEAAWLSLFEEFAGKSVEEVDKASNNDATEDATEYAAEDVAEDATEDAAGDMIGILGATPLETGYIDKESLLSAMGSPENVVLYSLGSTLDDIRNAPNMKKHIVVSPAALKAAEYLKSKFGVPYEVGYPFIPQNVVDESVAALTRIAADAGNSSDASGSGDTCRILILHSQFSANELRQKLRNVAAESDISVKIDCATFFMQSPDYAEAGDIHLNDEDDLYELASSGSYDMIIGDADIRLLLNAAEYKGTLVDYPHFAISGR